MALPKIKISWRSGLSDRLDVPNLRKQTLDIASKILSMPLCVFFLVTETIAFWRYSKLPHDLGKIKHNYIRIRIKLEFREAGGEVDILVRLGCLWLLQEILSHFNSGLNIGFIYSIQSLKNEEVNWEQTL